jgi:hypothetical protein
MKKYKNYLILILLFVASVIGCIYALKWHAVYLEDKLNTTIITDYIHELKKEEFINYISDNPYAVIYIGVTSNENCRRFEKNFKNYIVNNNLRETIVYMNVNELAGNDFGTKLDNIYNTKALREEGKKFNAVPTVAIYDHTTLVDFVSDNNLSIESVDKLLKKYNFNGE